MHVARIIARSVHKIRGTQTMGGRVEPAQQLPLLTRADKTRFAALLTEAVRKTPAPNRTKHIQRLRRQIGKGQYSPNPRAVARHIIEWLTWRR